MRQSKFQKSVRHAKVTTGETIRMLRELKGWTQSDLAKKADLAVSNISQLENDRIEIGKTRAIKIAKAFKLHPAIVMFPEYDITSLAHLT